MTRIVVTGLNAAPVSIAVAAHDAAIAALVRARNRGPQPILSMLIIAAMSTLGSRLKCMSAIHIPPHAESVVRLIRSTACGSALRRAAAQAACGHPTTLMASSVQGSHDARCS
jgi:hypothetical protein